MKNVLKGSVIAATLAIAGTAMGQSGNGTVHAQAVQVSASVEKNEYVFEETTQTTWSYTAKFDDFFQITASSGNTNNGRLADAKTQALAANKCNFWNGMPLMGGTVNFGGSGGAASYTYQPKSPNLHAAKTGWTSVSTSTGNGFEPIEVTLSDIYIQVQSYMQKNKAGSGANAWRTKYNFGFAALEALRIEVVHEDGSAEPIPAVVLFDMLNPVAGQGDVVYVSGNHMFNLDDAVQHGNNTARAALRGGGGEMMNDILASDDFQNNNGQGGQRAHISDLMYTINAPGTYTFKLVGKVKGLDFDRAAQDIDVTVSVQTVTIGAPSCN